MVFSSNPFSGGRSWLNRSSASLDREARNDPRDLGGLPPGVSFRHAPARSQLPGPGDRESGGGAVRTPQPAPTSPFGALNDRLSASLRGGASGGSSSSSVSIPQVTGGGGGGGGGGAQSISAPSNANFGDALAAIEQQRKRAEDERKGLESQFEDAREQLREEFSFAETEQEKAQLAFLLGDLERQREAGHEAIGVGYQRAIESITERSEAAREASVADGVRMNELFTGAADQLEGRVASDAAASAEAGRGTGVGVAERASGADDFVNLMRAAAPREQALSERLGSLQADEAAAMAGSMDRQQEAQRADLGRLAMATSAQATYDHGRQVADRIAQERAQWRDQVAQMQQLFTGRGFSLEDAIRQTFGDESQMQFQAGESMAGREMQARTTNAQLAEQAAARRQSAANAAASRRQQAQIANQRAALQQQGGGGGPENPFSSPNQQLGFLTDRQGIPEAFRGDMDRQIQRLFPGAL